MSFKAGGIPYTVVGTPEKNTGVRLIGAKELAGMLNNSPILRDAVDRVESHDFGGKPTAIKMVVRKDTMETRHRVKNAKMAIDMAKQKHEGKGHYAQ